MEEQLHPTSPEAENNDSNAVENAAENTAEEQAVAALEDVEEPETAPAPVADEATRDDEDPEAIEEVREAARPLTKAEIIARLEELTKSDATDITTEEINRLKQQFYHLHNEDLRQAHDKWVADGNDPSAFAPGLDPDEDRMRMLMAVVKEKKAEQRRVLDEQRAANLEKKRALIAELNTMAEDTDNVNRHFNRAKEIQAEYNAAGDVPDTEATALRKEYQDALERYYDQLKVNKELRDYDFKKNLADKEMLVEEAKKLSDEPDVIAAFRRLQDLHERWRRIGPVAKELREELWARFKDASAEINKRYQAHFEERKAKESENEALKTALCERVEALDFSQCDTPAKWDEMTRRFLAAQEEWKTIGFASRKSNNALFARFRQCCDAFFAAKSQHFKSMKEELGKNLEAKTGLVEAAEKLQDSTDWRATTDKIVELQRQWKTIGAVPRKHSESLWKRFQAACDAFFAAKKEATGGVRRTEQANLRLKQEIIDRLAAMTAPDAPQLTREQAQEEVDELKQQWDEVGHVPFRMKDKIYDSYRELLRAADSKFDLRGRTARIEKWRQDVAADSSKAGSERRRLERQLEARRQDLQTYENNMGFLSFKQKGTGENPLLKDMERRKAQIREEIATILQKLQMLDDANED